MKTTISYVFPFTKDMFSQLSQKQEIIAQYTNRSRASGRFCGSKSISNFWGMREFQDKPTKIISYSKSTIATTKSHVQHRNAIRSISTRPEKEEVPVQLV